MTIPAGLLESAGGKLGNVLDLPITRTFDGPEAEKSLLNYVTYLAKKRAVTDATPYHTVRATLSDGSTRLIPLRPVPQNKTLFDMTVDEIAPLLPEGHADNLRRHMAGSVVQTPVAHGTQAAEFPFFDKTKDVGYHSGTPDAANDILKDKAYGLNIVGDPTVGGTKYPSGARVMPLWLRATNPVEMRDLGLWFPEEIIQDLKQSKVLNEKEAMQGMRTRAEDGQQAAFDWIRKTLKSKGYDSIKYVNEHEGEGSTSYIGLDKGQYKHVFGNRGTYDMAHDELAYGAAPIPLPLLMAQATQARGGGAPTDPMRAPADATMAVPAAPARPAPRAVEPGRQALAGAVEGVANLPMDALSMLMKVPFNPAMNAAWGAVGSPVEDAYHKGASAFANLLARTGAPKTAPDSTIRHAAGLAASFAVPVAGEAALSRLAPAAEAALPTVANAAPDPLLSFAGRDPAAVFARMRPTEDLLAQHAALDWRLPIEKVLFPRTN